MNYLVVTIHRTPTSFKTATYKKPTFTDTIKPYSSNHLTHHKYAAVRFLFNRLDSYNQQHEEYQHELNIIHNILQNNSFPIKPHKPHTPKSVPLMDPKTPQKWASFTYVGKETSYITNIFRQTDLKVAFRTKSTIGNLLTHKNSLDRQTSIHNLEHTNFPSLTAIRLTSGKLIDHFNEIQRHKLPSVTITKHTALQNTSMILRTPSAL